jgi:hypothetical protein
MYGGCLTVFSVTMEQMQFVRTNQNYTSKSDMQTHIFFETVRTSTSGIFQFKEMNATVKDFKKCLEEMDAYNPATCAHHWLLHVPWSILGKHYFLRLVLKDNDGLNEYHSLMSMANDSERYCCNTTLEEFILGDITVEDDFATNALKKEFCNRDVEYTEMDQLVLNTWLQ